MRVRVGDGVGLAVRIAGPRNAPGLLLVHGFGGAKEDFADHFESFAGRYRVAVFDHRGHGESDAPDDPAAYSLDRLATDALEVAEALELGALRLLGHSMGGMVARRVVLRHPERVAAVVLMDTSPGRPAGIDPDVVAAGVRIAAEQGMAELKRVQDELDPLGSAAYRRVLAERPGYREYCDAKWDTLSPVMWMTLVEEIARQPDELAALRAVRVPTLVVVGEQDDVFVPAALAMADAIPGARLEIIADAGHSPQFENPDAWAKAVDEFLQEVDSLFASGPGADPHGRRRRA